MINLFIFEGEVVSKPETRKFDSTSKTSFAVSQTSVYRDVEKKTEVNISSWHKGESLAQTLRPGDKVLIKGKFTSSPYKERFITNMDAQDITLMSYTQAPEAVLPKDGDIPF